MFVLLIGCVNIANLLLVRTTARVRDFATRHALGAGRFRIIRLVGKQWIRMVWLGLGIGVAGALTLTRLIVTLLYDVTPTDPLVFIGALVVLGTAALAACLLPTWRATRVNPIQALSAE